MKTLRIHKYHHGVTVKKAEADADYLIVSTAMNVSAAKKATSCGSWYRHRSSSNVNSRNFPNFWYFHACIPKTDGPL